MLFEYKHLSKVTPLYDFLVTIKTLHLEFVSIGRTLLFAASITAKVRPVYNFLNMTINIWQVSDFDCPTFGQETERHRHSCLMTSKFSSRHRLQDVCVDHRNGTQGGTN